MTANDLRTLENMLGSERDYTPYSLAFKLAGEGKEWNETTVERRCRH